MTPYKNEDSKIIIRQFQKDDFKAWEELYEIYAGHYKMPLTNAAKETTWSWLMDPRHPLKGLRAETEKKVQGLIHFRAMPSPLRGREIGFIDDIVVRPEQRGKGIGKKLLMAVQAYGAKQNWQVIRWTTKEDNINAQKLYDNVAKKTDRILYEMESE